MTSHIAKGPFIQVVKRQLATQVAVQPSGGKGTAAAQETKISTLENGLTIASCDNGSPLTTLGLVVKAGSRYETYDNAGIAHALRLAAGLGTKKHSHFGITRNLEQQGTRLECSLSRDTISYTISAEANAVPEVVDFFLESISGQVFKRWEVEDYLYPRMKLDLASLSNEARAEDLLHKAAFRSGLGNALFSPDYMLEKHRPALMQAFYNQNFTAQRSTLVGVGFSHEELAKYSGILELEKGQGPSNKAKYFGGGELRHDGGGRNALVMLATGCGGLESQKEAIAALLLARILGTGSRVKYGNGSSKLQQAVGDAGVATGLHFLHSDAGLIGVRVEAPAAEAGRAVEAAAAFVRSFTVTEAELAAAKKMLSMEASELHMSPPKLAQSMAVEAMALKNVVSSSQVATMINSCALGDVQALAKKLSGGKLTMSAVGNLSTVPYLDSL